jgi:hypothetical protein
MENPSKNRHRVLKLRDGTDIIGKVVGMDKEGVVIDTPMVYEMTPIFDSKGKIKYFTISFRKWFEFAKTQRYYFPKDYIVAHSEPERDLIRDYIRARRANISFQKTKDMSEDEYEKDGQEKLDSLLFEDIMNKLVDDIIRGTQDNFNEKTPNSQPTNFLEEKGGTFDKFWREFPLL